MLFLDPSHYKLFKNKTNEVQIKECRESPQAIHEVNATKKPSLAWFIPPKDGSSPRVIGSFFAEGTEERPWSKNRPTDNWSDTAHSRLNRSEDGTSTVAARKFYSRDAKILEIGVNSACNLHRSQAGRDRPMDFVHVRDSGPMRNSMHLSSLRVLFKIMNMLSFW